MESLSLIDESVALSFLNDPDSVDLSLAKSITTEAAVVLAGYRGRLSLDGLRHLSDEAATALSAHRGPMFFGDLDASPEAILSLAEANDILGFDWWELPSVEVARALAGNQCALWLDSLQTLDAPAAQALASTPADLSMDSLEELNEEAAVALSRHQGRLSIQGVNRLSDAAEAALRSHPDIQCALFDS